MTTPTQKTCHGVLLSADAFAANKSNPDGLQRYCRECQRTMRSDWTKRNTAKIEADLKKKREERAARRSAIGEFVTGDGTGEALPPVSNDMRNAVGVAALSPSTRLDTAPSTESETGDYLVPQDTTVRSGGNLLAELDHGAIVPSLTNPRKHFDHAFIKELAESIKKQGLAAPILVRPLPASRIEETSYAPLAPTDAWPFNKAKRLTRPTHEIVAGEQRWRACGIAGVRTIPVLIRNLTDEQVLQLQLVENLKRRDLHPMEEAEGYERLREVTGMSADDLAESIGKSRAYVYKTLKLLDLEPEAREALYAGKLTRSTAELVAMRPPNLQIQLLREITAPDHLGEGMSYRKAKEHIDNRYMLRLGTAAFKITDVDLVPDAGSCHECPKRSGANPELFDDVSHADTCTDPTCFASKKDAHYLHIRTQAEARGQTVITGKEAREIMPTSAILRGYTKVDDSANGGMKTLRRVLGTDMPATTLIEDPSTHQLVEVLPTAVVGKLLKDKGISKAQTQANDVDPDEAEVARQAGDTYAATWRKNAIEATYAAACKPDAATGVSVAVLRHLCLTLLDGLGKQQLAHIAELLHIGKVAQAQGLVDFMTDTDEVNVEPTMGLLLMQHDIGVGGSKRIEAVANDYGVDLKIIQSSVKRSIREAASAKKVDAGVAAVISERNTSGPKPVRKSKLTKESAPAAIAQALDAATNPNAFKAGDRVTVRIDLRRGSDSFKTAGTPAEIVGATGDRAWEVQPDHLNFTLIADYTELEAIEP